MEQFTAYIERNKPRFQQEYFDLLRIPSVAAQGRGIVEAATWVQQRLIRLGAADARLIDTGGSPVVYGTLGSGEPRLLIYDHYDVQPEDPLDLWDFPPFEPTVHNGNIYARGASDNKGNLMLRIQAIEAWLATQGDLPCSMAFIIEGEEEIGSPNLPAFCKQYADLLQADGCLWETGKRDSTNQPAIDCGAKGLLYVELVARGAAYDLHSSYAPIVPNPAWRLVWALQRLKNPDETICIPGWYDYVRQPSEADLAALHKLPNQETSMLEEFGIGSFLGNRQGADLWHKLLFSPTCTICGMITGYTSDGAKTVLPSEARVKLDFRLVPDMEPIYQLTLLRTYLDTQGFTDVEIINHGGVHPARSDITSPIVKATAAAAETVYGTAPNIYPTMAGTGPWYAVCQQFGTNACSGAGCGYAGEKIHSPNENIREQDYWQAMLWMGYLIQNFGKR